MLVLSLLPQSLRPWDTLGYVGDPLDSVYALHWNARHLHAPHRLPDSNLLHPNPRPWLLAPHRLLSSVVAAPALLLTGNAVLGANIALGVAYLLAAMGGRHLAATAWEVPHALDGDEFLEVTFGRPLAVSGLVLALDRQAAFPLPFRVAGLTAESGWIELARFNEAHVLQLVDQMMRDPGRTRLGFDLGGREVLGLRLMVSDGATSFDGWWLPEVEVWVP